MSEREFDIIVYGASGFTGRLVAEYMQQQYGRSVNWAMAGRSTEKLAQVRDEMGIDAATPLIAANADNEAELAAMAARTEWQKPDGSPLVDRLLLDNHTPAEAAAMVGQWGGTIPLEASGGITPDNARAYADAGVDFVSMGWITHSVKGMDFSLKSAAYFNG